MDIASLTHRDQIPALLDHLGLTRWAVEVGVDMGHYSEILLAGCRLDCLFSVDCWAGARRYDGHHYTTLAEYRMTVARLARFGSRSRVMQGYSLDAASWFEPGSLDMVYIDSSHEETSTLDEMIAWWEAVRPGGIMAGHDYNMDAGPDGTYHPNGVMRAVDFWCEMEGYSPHLTECDGIAYMPGLPQPVTVRSWLIRKP